ncbi:2-amino-4-hydroxy-6-hydroxymethyldihydropteridine diphosphokinase [Anaerocolumna sp. MB42-C2]|uniref:2-amino-4-hydroxy-6- hydroxymethyldihydropteridine diphosphokinase n=1 Tax=Anaerocolumna sp. MB42-C2 TaxID=3070997 RepID=UPI0027E0EAD5|nr:2-amino-4-hydroxy-6-hydroxymethyldihydropteridine diphosphokinase [Anaerocolumna sp. MB42-C2]WMJ87625.1 2-amino-4-hydroxy-6-hydroxymethyldihydropteridine diphosphokinase [Anaerocolumna sp. MB42-C2]
MDQIRITNLEVFGHHGVYKEENVLGQKFLVSVILYADLWKASCKDDLTKSVNYGEVCHFIKREMEKYTFKLIETLTEHLAREILIHFPVIEKINLEVKKPWAPILLPIETVSVVMERVWHRAYLSIGSNLGDKEQNLKTAVELLKADNLCKVGNVSNFIVTAPVGGVCQDDFLNGALELKTLRTPYELLELIHEIEATLKRERIIHWGPRTIDLDILYYDDEVVNDKDLIIPHPEIKNREFVLKPLNEIAPNHIHPIYNITTYQMLQKLI